MEDGLGTILLWGERRGGVNIGGGEVLEDIGSVSGISGRSGISLCSLEDEGFFLFTDLLGILIGIQGILSSSLSFYLSIVNFLTIHFILSISRDEMEFE